MNEKFDYTFTEDDFLDLKHAYILSTAVSFGSPDQYQFHQNNLSKAIANFLLKPYEKNLQEKEDEEPS